MTHRPLLPVMIVATVALVAINIAVLRLSHRLPYNVKLDSIQTTRVPDPNLVFVGNSLLDHHIDVAALVHAASAGGVTFVPLDAALGAALPPEHELLFDYAVRQHPGIHTLVVGVLDFQLTDQFPSRLIELTGNRMVGLDVRFPAVEVMRLYHFSTVDRIGFHVVRVLPMVANRANIWKHVELLRRRMGEIGLTHEATNGMGRVEDFAALEASSGSAFDATALHFLNEPSHFNEYYEAIFRRAKQSGIRVVIVVMPMSPYHWSKFYSRPSWTSYVAALTSLAHDRGIAVIDASSWLTSQNDFADHLHMKEGEPVHAFSVRLGAQLAAPDM
jgi:hypothetical protein